MATSNTVSIVPPPSISIANVTIAEGDRGTATATFTVTLSAPSPHFATLSYTTVSGTATQGSDFVATSGTLSFPAGTTTRTIDAAVTGDTDVEANQMFTVNFANPGNAAIADGQGIGTIINDDAPSVPTISASPTSVAPAGLVTITTADGPGNRLDWIALRSGGVNVDWWYLNGLKVPPRPGADRPAFRSRCRRPPGPTTSCGSRMTDSISWPRAER